MPTNHGDWPCFGHMVPLSVVVANDGRLDPPHHRHDAAASVVARLHRQLPDTRKHGPYNASANHHEAQSCMCCRRNASTRVSFGSVTQQTMARTVTQEPAPEGKAKVAAETNERYVFVATSTGARMPVRDVAAAVARDSDVRFPARLGRYVLRRQQSMRPLAPASNMLTPMQVYVSSVWICCARVTFANRVQSRYCSSATNAVAQLILFRLDTAACIASPRFP
jgi:hypothetical protein